MSLPVKLRTLPAVYSAKATQDAIQDVLTALNNGYKHVQFQEQNVAPERTIEQMVTLADGSNFDPASGYGSGLYRLDADGTWNRILEHSRPLMLNPRMDGNQFYRQRARIVVSTASATITGDDMLVKLIDYTSTGGNLTTDSGASIDSAIRASLGTALSINFAFDFSIINSGSGSAVVVAGAAITLIGSMTIGVSASGYFSCRKTAADTFTIYRRA